MDSENTMCNNEPLFSMVEPLKESCQWHLPKMNNNNNNVVEQLLNKDGLTGTGFWITVLGVILGAVSLLILFSVILLYLQDGRWTCSKEHRGDLLKRVPSDMVNLIPRCSVIGEKL